MGFGFFWRRITPETREAVSACLPAGRAGGGINQCVYKWRRTAEQVSGVERIKFLILFC